MQKITILIADDMETEIINITRKIQGYEREEIELEIITPACTDVENTLSTIMSKIPNIVFLDIRFENGSDDFEFAGFKIAEKLIEHNYFSSAIIFATNYDNQTNREKYFQLAGYDFIHKPSEAFEYYKIIDKYVIDFWAKGVEGIKSYNKLKAQILSQKNINENIFYFKANLSKDDRQCNYDNVLYLESDGEMTNFKFINSTKMTKSRVEMKSWISILPITQFRQIKKGVIINMKYFSKESCLKQNKDDNNRIDIFIKDNSELIKVIDVRKNAGGYFDEFLGTIS